MICTIFQLILFFIIFIQLSRSSQVPTYNYGRLLCTSTPLETKVCDILHVAVTFRKIHNVLFVVASQFLRGTNKKICYNKRLGSSLSFLRNTPCKLQTVASRSSADKCFKTPSSSETVCPKWSIVLLRSASCQPKGLNGLAGGRGFFFSFSTWRIHKYCLSKFKLIYLVA